MRAQWIIGSVVLGLGSLILTGCDGGSSVLPQAIDLPRGFPRDVPLPEGRILDVTSPEETFGDEWTVVVRADARVQAVKDYTRRLEDSGFEIRGGLLPDDEGEDADVLTFLATRGDQFVSLLADTALGEEILVSVHTTR